MTNRSGENYRPASKTQNCKSPQDLHSAINSINSPSSIKSFPKVKRLSMYPWHGPNNHASNPPPPGPLAPPTQTPSSSYAVHQPFRWLPSVMSRPPNPQPAITSSLRMGLNRNPDHQAPVAMTVENRPESAESSDMDHSDSSPGQNARRPAGMDSLREPDYAAQAAGTHARGANPGVVGPVSNPLMRARPSVSEVEVEGSSVAGEDSNARKHGKRLTTKEEVTLFEICNRQAHGFGQRSSLCKWWATVTDEFTRAHGHPYSWHSVRRKVETVTKQRMKFLDEQRDKGGGVGEDLSNPQWRATIDAWIPTWRRWEEAEARRIEKRDSRKPKKRKSRSWEGVDSVSDGWRQSASPAVGGSSNGGYPASTTASMAPPSSTPAVRLPPGFESMFPNQTPQTPAPRTGGYPFPGQSNYHASPPTGSPGMDNPVMTAMLETLNKLNKRLDSTPEAAANPRASPVISALVSTSESPSQASPNQTQEDRSTTSAPSPVSADMLNKLKEELRQEMRRELEKDRAGLEEKLDAVQRTQDMILEMLRQEPT